MPYRGNAVVFFRQLDFRPREASQRPAYCPHPLPFLFSLIFFSCVPSSGGRTQEKKIREKREGRGWCWCSHRMLPQACCDPPAPKFFFSLLFFFSFFFLLLLALSLVLFFRIFAPSFLLVSNGAWQRSFLAREAALALGILEPGNGPGQDNGRTAA